MAADHLKTATGFEVLFKKNVPHVLEKIFFQLDYESFQACSQVCATWSELFSSESYRSKALFKWFCIGLDEPLGRKGIMAIKRKYSWQLKDINVWNNVASKLKNESNWTSPGECGHQAGVCPKLGWRCNGQTDRPTWIDGPCQRIGPSFSRSRNSLAWKNHSFLKYWQLFICSNLVVCVFVGVYRNLTTFL